MTAKRCFFCFLGVFFVKSGYDREICKRLLADKYADLLSSGQERFPRRSDFSEPEVVAIKAYLGPWPRALEAAGIKEARDDDRIAKNREKRIRAARRKTAAKKAKKADSPETKPTKNEDERNF